MFTIRRIVKRKGFTLIEILIVVAIIAVLTSVVVVGLGPTSRTGRDSRRAADLRQVQSALALYFNKCGYYPGLAAPTSPCPPFAVVTSWSAMRDALVGSNLGITNIPDDPGASPTRNYGYVTNLNGSQYWLAAVLDDPNSPLLRNDIDGWAGEGANGFDCGLSPASGIDTPPHYCVGL